nr:uncharacterized protein LOC108085308 [Drosophila kikkawai]
MFGDRSILFALFALLYLVLQVTSKFEFTNVKCTSLDEKFNEFEYCYIKSVNRIYKYLSLKVKLFKTPITKVRLNLALYKRYNGYRPFMYNLTIDACRILKVPASHPLANYFYSFLQNFSNMNHTCPFNHDLIVDKLNIDFVNNQATKVLPFPEGDYMLESQWIAYDINRAVVKIYGTLS